MSSLPPLNEGRLNLLVSYSRSSGEEMTEAVVKAFEAANIDAFERRTQLIDWINPDVLESLEWNPDQPLYLSTRIWEHQVVMTPEEIRIYTSSIHPTKYA